MFDLADVRIAGRRPPFRTRIRTGLPVDPVSRQSGFALVAVIWTLGLITLLGLAVIVGARYRAKVTSSDASATKAALAAETAVNFAIFAVQNRAPNQKNEFPLRCRLPGGESAFIAMEDESGKIDLNVATPAVLARFFTALTRDQSAGIRIAASIVEFRDRKADKPIAAPTPVNANNPAPAVKPRFSTIMQLDQIKGITPPLFKAATRFVTVNSGRSEPDITKSSPALRVLLNADRRETTPDFPTTTAAVVTIRADIQTPDGSRFIREALVSFGFGTELPFLVREWRHGNIDADDPMNAGQINAAVAGNLCFRVS